MKKQSLLLLLCVFIIQFSLAQVKNKAKDVHGKPTLVVGIVVDQMKWDFLYRFEKHYGNGGFKRLLNQGFNLNNVMIDYIPTVTAIGHTTIYTGSVPSIHGIAGNNWTDKATGKDIYCTTDSDVKGVGSSSEKIGAHSPKNLLSTTITDQLGLATNFRSKVVGISLKDRASILPAGHKPTAAFWFDDKTGDFITSSYYMSDLPQWMKDFNAQNHPQHLVAKGWNTIEPIEKYTESTRDLVTWEHLLGSATQPVFPYAHLATDYEKNKGLIRSTPFGNSYTLLAADAIVDAYNMGKNPDTDFLAINLASTDYVGHTFGPNSVEIEDTYIRLDRDLESFFNQLDKKVGKDNYLVFLTADHGAAHAEGFLKENKFPTGFFDEGLEKSLNQMLKSKLGVDKLILNLMNYQVYLNEASISENNLNQETIKNLVIDYLKVQPGILYAVDMQKVATASIPEPIKTKIINGYHWKRSGDIQIITNDGWLPSYAKKGTTHSVWNSYDAHIPLIFMGKGAKKGTSSKAYHMTDIAPTLAQILQIAFPSGLIGNPITEVFE